MPFRLSRLRTSPSGLALPLAVLIATPAWGQPESPNVAPMQTPPPIALTADEDHRRMMGLLGITSLRPGADPNNAEAPNAVNTDESKANPWPNLPDPLTLDSGAKVTSPEVWWTQRRPEIVEDFDREVYGRTPASTPNVTWEAVVARTEMNGETAATIKDLVGHVDNSAYPHIKVDIEVTLGTPANATGPVPVMMSFGWRRPANANRPNNDNAARPQRPPGEAPAGPSWQQQLLAKGWGYAVIYPSTIQADNGAGLTQGIIGLVNQGQPRGPEDWGALKAWAWGASKALDYFETDPAVDAKRVGIEGLSRYGKAALVTMAYDDRFAIGFIGSSGHGGAKLHRRNYGELVENVASAAEYHWMAGNYIKYAGPLNAGDLPVDSHELVALCAPRPVFISCGSTRVEGHWVDSHGQFLAAVAAGPVYELLGKRGLGVSELPPEETALIDGDLAFRQHAGGHTTGPNWPTFLQFAERYLADQPIAAVR